MKKKYFPILVAVLVVMLSACSEQTLYSWYNYNEALHVYSKKQTHEAKADVLNNLERILKKQRGTRKTVPPGIYAERAYIYIQNGEIEQAKAYLIKERDAYPESAVFINQILKQLNR